MTQYPPRQFVELTSPSAEPLTLAEAKLFLRVDGSEEDRLIAGFITTARQQAEHWLRRSLMTRRWKMTQSYQAGQPVQLSLGPVQSLEVVRITLNGSTHVMAEEVYVYDKPTERVALKSITAADTVEVEFIAGYGEAEHIPAAIRQALYEIIAHLYHHRGTGETMPQAVEALLQPYRKVAL